MRKQSELDSNQEQLLYNVAKALDLEHKHVLAHLLETYYTDYGSHIDTLKALIQVKEKLVAETNKLHDTIDNLKEKTEDLDLRLSYSNKVANNLKERTIEDRRLYEQLNLKLNERSQLDTTILEAIDLIKLKTKNEDRISPEKINEISDLMGYISYTIDERVKHEKSYRHIDFWEYHKTFSEFKKNKEFDKYLDDDETFVGYDDDELEVKEEIKETEILKSNAEKIFIIGGALVIDGVVLLWKALIMAKEHIFSLISWIKN